MLTAAADGAGADAGDQNGLVEENIVGHEDSIDGLHVQT